jgi:hypothetical protein
MYKVLWTGVSVGEPGEGFRLQENCEGLWRWAPLSLGASLGNLGEGSYVSGLCVEEGSGMGISPYRGPVWGPGERGLSAGNFERWREGAMGWDVSLKRLNAEDLEGGILYWVP